MGTPTGGRPAVLIELEADIPESREIRLTLPPDTPTGRVRVTVSAVAPPAAPPTHPKLAREHDAFRAMLPDLMRDHPGRHVAIHNGEVIAVGDSTVAVLTAAERTHPGAFPLVRLVSDQPRPPERLPSIRRPRGAA
jgi:hypothetical protein